MPLVRCSLVAQVRNEGTAALYAGLSAALARQASYTTLRLGLYDFMKKLVLDCEHESRHIVLSFVLPLIVWWF